MSDASLPDIVGSPRRVEANPVAMTVTLILSLSRGSMNKRKLAELAASRYPVLAHEARKEKTINNPYQIRMFEAVALGSVCLHQLDGSCIRRDDR
jgi:hypothetical protein